MTKAGAADLRWTSMPRWRAPQLPPASSYLASWFGEAARRNVETLLATADPAVPVRRAALGPDLDTRARTELGKLLRGCVTGVRIILAGPEAVVMQAAALARDAGALSEELVLLADEARPGPARTAGTDAEGREHAGEYHAGAGGRRVYCVTCQRPFSAVAALGEPVTCPRCAARLTVDPRFSRVHAAYLGWPSGPDPPQ